MAIRPGMQYTTLLAYARAHTHRDAPGLARRRYLLINPDGSIAYDHFLSLVGAYGLNNPLVRKVMYFAWAYRDDRIRMFICDKIADKRGVWNVERLIDKKNAKFFERWVRPSTATKARSNLEFFLVETKIFDPRSKKIHLELDDGWLQHGAIVAAQHERNAATREELLANPIAFLQRRGWAGLLNGNVSKSPPTLTTDAVPLEDAAIGIREDSVQTSFDWDRKPPTSSGKSLAAAQIDLIARERASLSHFKLEELLAKIAKRKGLEPKYNQNIDLFFKRGNRCILVEIKSCMDSNFHSQLRKAVGQLLEYQFVYRKLLGPSITKLILMETAPPKEKIWLLEYARSLGILVAWADYATKEIVTICTPPTCLAGFVRRISV